MSARIDISLGSRLKRVFLRLGCRQLTQNLLHPAWPFPLSPPSTVSRFLSMPTHRNLTALTARQHLCDMVSRHRPSTHGCARVHALPLCIHFWRKSEERGSASSDMQYDGSLLNGRELLRVRRFCESLALNIVSTDCTAMAKGLREPSR